MSNEDLEYRMACTEVLEILKHMPKKKVEKIPDSVIKSMQRLKRYDYKFKYDRSKTLKEQNTSKRTKAILAMFYRDYWANEDIRKIILAKEKFDRKSS